MAASERNNRHDERAFDGRRGRTATKPQEIPGRGWLDVAWRTAKEVQDDNLTLVAAGVAFYAFLAIFPAIIALVSIYGLITDPATVEQQFNQVSGVMPGAARDILTRQLQRVASSDTGALSLGFVTSLLVTLWSANKGIKGLITALNITYDEEEDRGFFKLNGISLLLTFGGIVLAILALAFVVALPAALGNLGLGGVWRTLIGWLRWPLLALFVMGGLAVLYHFGPSRDRPRWRWTSSGAVAATLLWLAASVGFSVFVSRFGSYDKTYGSISAVVILLLWFFFSALAVLLGSELNAESERQTRRDTTGGPPEPMGERGAHAADTIGRDRH